MCRRATEEKLVPVVIPALVVMLVHAEDKKGSPLTMDEVLQMRDGSAVMMLGLSASNARITFTDSSGSALQGAVSDARNALAVFRATLADAKHAASPLIKVKLVEPTYSANMWLLVTDSTAVDFSARLFEVPEAFKTFKAGDTFTVRDEEVLDWMQRSGWRLISM